jgi:hypothetical protein
MGPHDTIQDKSFVVYESIRYLEKMGDKDWANVRRLYYTVYVVHFGSLELFTCVTNLVEILVEHLTFSPL